MSSIRRLPKAARRIVADATRARPPCILCHAPFWCAGLFVPSHPARWGIAAGWQGGFAHGLCERCAALDDLAQRVDALLWASRPAASARWN